MIHNLKPYPAYKDSGVSWLGDVPEHWEIQKLKHLTQFHNGLAFKPSDWKDTGTPIIRIQNLNGSEEFNYTTRQDLPKFLLICPGDLLFSWSGNRGTSFGPFIWRRPFEGYLNQHIFKLDGYKLDTHYFAHLLRAVTKHIEDQTHGIIGLVHITKPELGAVCVPVAPFTEQSSIVRYLDHMDRHIRRYIRAKQKLIKLLEEQKQLIIHQAVTRGLNPNVKLKPSGVEWLGDVPEHWEVIPLKSLSTVQSGITLGKQYIGQKLVEFPYLRVANVQEGYVNLSEIKTIKVPIGEVTRSVLQKGDVLMTEGGDPDKLGRGCVWEGQISPCLHQNHIFAVRPDVNRLRPYYLAALLSSQYAKEYFLRTAKQTTNLASTNKTTIGQFPILLPKAEEQDSILQELQKKLAGIEQTVFGVYREISLLREYRTRLIADVVTGKLDVREAAANLPEISDEKEVEDDFEEETIEESLEEVVTEEMVEGEV